MVCAFLYIFVLATYINISIMKQTFLLLISLFTLAFVRMSAQHICEGILKGKYTSTPGDNRSLPHIVDKYGVKINYGQAQMR